VTWPFCIRLTEGVEIYLPVTWTSAAAAYVLGPAVLPVYWIAALLGFVLIVLLDGAAVVPATGLAAESARRYRAEPYAAESIVDGDLRHSLSLSEHAVRVAAAAGARAAGLSMLGSVFVAEAAVGLWLRMAPVPGRMAPARTRARLAAALGHDMPAATALLHVVIVCFLLLSHARGGTPAFAAASLSTLALHAILKRLNDTRLESERRRTELVAMQDELDRRQRLAAIGQTASGVFHQIARHHGAIGMYAHLLARGPRADGEPADVGRWEGTVRDHAGRIATSVGEANRVIDELLRFGQDRALALYPQPLDALVRSCVAECEPRARARGVAVTVAVPSEVTVTLDSHKIKQALGNLLDNAIDATPAGGPIEVAAGLEGGSLRIAVRDRGPGVAAEIQPRLFIPFCTTKAHGTGLGLALARELVEAHGGRLDWESAAGGAVFTITLPLVPRVPEGEAPAGA
jgi:signal transduction histidine kinase